LWANKEYDIQIHKYIVVIPNATRSVSDEGDPGPKIMIVQDLLIYFTIFWAKRKGRPVRFCRNKNHMLMSARKMRLALTRISFKSFHVKYGSSVQPNL